MRETKLQLWDVPEAALRNAPGQAQISLIEQLHADCDRQVEVGRFTVFGEFSPRGELVRRRYVCHDCGSDVSWVFGHVKFHLLVLASSYFAGTEARLRHAAACQATMETQEHV